MVFKENNKMNTMPILGSVMEFKMTENLDFRTEQNMHRVRRRCPPYKRRYFRYCVQNKRPAEFHRFGPVETPTTSGEHAENCKNSFFCIF